MSNYKITIMDSGKHPELVGDVLTRIAASGAVDNYTVTKLLNESTADFTRESENHALMPVVELLSAAGAEIRVTESKFAIADNKERVFDPRQGASSKLVEQSAAWIDLEIIAEQEKRRPTVPSFSSGNRLFSQKGLEEALMEDRSPKGQSFRVPVFFATDRVAEKQPYSQPTFTRERGDLSFGRTTVNVPRERDRGAIPKKPWWQLREKQDKHFSVMGTTQLAQTTFIDDVRKAQDDLDATVLLYIHGYNTTFAQAVERAAQLTVDLQFPGAPIVYSWPSQESWIRYTIDETNADWTSDHFRDFIELLTIDCAATSLKCIAHSMGNRILVDGLRWLSSLPARRQSVAQAVMAAPDVDTAVFRRRVKEFAGANAQCTLYASSADRMLRLSHLLNGFPRAGDAGQGLVLMPSLETIDASAIGTSLFGHNYFSKRRSILGDLHALFVLGIPIEKRFGLKAQEHNGQRYFIIEP